MPDLFLIGLQGIVIGFSIAAPVGPIGVLCIRRTLSQGRWAGFFSGLGAATADALYGSLAVIGITSLTSLFVTQQNWLRIVAGIFLLAAGIRITISRPSERPVQVGAVNWMPAYFSTFLLTLTNPLTILSFTAVFVGLGLGSKAGEVSSGAVLVLGVFTGSASWWLLLSAIVSYFRERLSSTGLVWVNRMSGTVIFIFGVGALLLAGSSQNQKISSALVVDQSSQTQSLIPHTSLPGFRRVVPGQSLTFPEDQGPHPDYKTEWWYYTGNLAATDGRRFGYQLTFFRRALLPRQVFRERETDWAAEQVYLAHFALTDVNGNRHESFERLGRGAAGLAGARARTFEVWLDDWYVIQTGPGVYKLHAAQQVNQADWLRIDLDLKDIKGPILHGENGYSQKGPDVGNASNYYSFSRLESAGSVTVNGHQFSVVGLSWMDHEYSTSALTSNQVGWDWFSLQMDDGSELMVFQIWKQDGTVDSFSSGTYISPDGSAIHLNRGDFTIQVLDTWESKKSGGIYPSRWRVNILTLDLELEIIPLIPDQEMNLTYTYWEGAVRFQGRRGADLLGGYGFVELTGYAGSMAGEF